MPEANGRENSVDMNRRDFLGKSGAALAAVGVAAHVASGTARGQDNTCAPIVRQTVLQGHMQKADSATSRIGKRISAGLLDEVAAGAGDLEKVFRATGEIHIQQTAERQAAWQKRSLEQDVARALPQRHGRPLVFVDTTIPRDVEETVGDLSTVYRYDIDDLHAALDANHAQRQAAIPEVETIIAQARKRYAHSPGSITHRCRFWF